MKTKICKKCGVRKSLEEFHRRIAGNSKDGREWRCKPCRKEYRLAWQRSERGKSWGKEYREKRRGSYEVALINLRACFLKRTPHRNPRMTVTIEDLKAIVKRLRKKCFYCREKMDKLEFDHIFPISRGGPHTPENLTLACGTCNKKKGNKILIGVKV